MTTAKEILIRLFKQSPRRHLALLLGGVAVLLCRGIYQSRAAANFIAQRITGPAERGVARLLGFLPFSFAELCWAFCILFVLWAVWNTLRQTLRHGFFGLWKGVLTLAVFGVWLYAGFCLLWGVNYYADSFSDKSGLRNAPVSVSQLESAAAYFVQKVNETEDFVARDESGCAVLDGATLLSDSLLAYTGIEKEYPFLAVRPLRPKPVAFSRLMSRLDFTGFYFPFTGEANINMDFPAALRPFTIAHELAHQRGVAAEQEANFVGIQAAVTSGLPAYEYSGWLAGCLYLGNALYSADPQSWLAISANLCDGARADFNANNTYWAAFQEKPAANAAGSVYDSFLKSYDQKLGRKSYGACVDLLCAYYAPEK